MTVEVSPRERADVALLARYDRPGPRYTSYPTAPFFTEQFSSGDHREALAAEARPLSLYFHLPFCARLCYFCGCTMVVSHNRERIARYVDYLIREMVLYAGHTGGRLVRQVHWGGGTPTHLTPEEIIRLGEAMHRYYRWAEDAEVSVEVDPRTTTEAHLDALRAVGFNRISLGVQDFHEPTQHAVNRVQSEAEVRALVAAARERGFTSINLDFIYGLPYQTPETFAVTVEQMIALRPERIALFSYAHVPWMKKHQRVLDPATMPTADDKLRIFVEALDRLTGAGYVYIGMDHFALPGDGLVRALEEKTLYRNFQGYTTEAHCDLVGHGISAIGQTRMTYAQNTKDFKAYYAALDAGRLPIERGYRLTPEDLLRREVIMRIMCEGEVPFTEIENAYGIDFHDHFASALEALKPLEADGLVTLTPDTLQVTDRGRLLLRNIAMPFDAYLQQKAEVRFSRTI